MQIYKRRTLPFKVLYYLLYQQESEYLRRDLDKTGVAISIRIGPAARTFRVSNDRLVESLEYLEALGLISNYCKTRGQADFYMTEPLGFETIKIESIV